MYQPGLSTRPFVIAANKGDSPRAERLLRELRAEVAAREARGELPGLVGPEPGGSRVTAVSALYRRNLDRLIGRMHAALTAARSGHAGVGAFSPSDSGLPSAGLQAAGDTSATVTSRRQPAGG